MKINEWLQERRKGIGGSDASAVCGLNPWKTPYQVWADKVGEADPQDDNNSMLWGRALEPVIRQHYADVTGRKVIIPENIIKHPYIPYIIGNLDGIADSSRVLEIKTARSAQGWGYPETDEIPEPYYIQVQHYMMITSLPVADVAVLIGGSDFRIYEIPGEPEIQQMLLEKERNFWTLYVEKHLPPDPISFADAKARFGFFSKSKSVQLNIDTAQAVSRLHQVKNEIAELKTEEEKMKAVIMLALGEGDTLVDGDKPVVTWKMSKPGTKFDVDSFKAVHPGIYKEFLKETKGSRRFLLK